MQATKTSDHHFKWSDVPGEPVWNSPDYISWPLLKIEHPSKEQFDEIWEWLNDHVNPWTGKEFGSWNYFLQTTITQTIGHNLDGSQDYSTKLETPIVYFGVDPAYFPLMMLRFK